MTKILAIQSSLSGEKGQSSQLIAHFLSSLPAGTEVHTRDVVAQPLPLLAMTEMGSWMTASTDRTAEQQQLAALSDTAIAEVSAADLLVVAAPMYNFAIPAQLKAWLDRLARAGITFKYTEQGPVGLLADKPVIIVLSRGGVHKGQPSDSQVSFLTTFFNFIGLKNLHFVYAEGLNMGPDAAAAALQSAKAQLTQLATQLVK
jgi:FMN-dependent NADH-azoreductase